MPAVLARAARVPDYVDCFQRHEPVGDNPVDDRNERVNLLLAIDDLDDDGKIRRQIENACRVHDGVCAESLDALEDGRP